MLSFFMLTLQMLLGSAFHGLIQLGYGANVDNERVVAEGLAYIHHSYVSFMPAKRESTDGDNAEKKIDIKTALQRIRENSKFSRVVQEHSEEMRKRFGKTSGFQCAMLALSEYYSQQDLGDLALQISIPKVYDGNYPTFKGIYGKVTVNCICLMCTGL